MILSLTYGRFPWHRGFAVIDETGALRFTAKGGLTRLVLKDPDGNDAGCVVWRGFPFRRECGLFAGGRMVGAVKRSPLPPYPTIKLDLCGWTAGADVYGLTFITGPDGERIADIRRDIGLSRRKLSVAVYSDENVLPALLAALAAERIV
ncbi:MAG: hypothetical protein J5586_05590 [Clostridia bacterium]|nr:hypothetical protein [Clostridia bacterium]